MLYCWWCCATKEEKKTHSVSILHSVSYIHTYVYMHSSRQKCLPVVYNNAQPSFTQFYFRPLYTFLIFFLSFSKHNIYIAKVFAKVCHFTKQIILSSLDKLFCTYETESITNITLKFFKLCIHRCPKNFSHPLMT